MSISDPVDRLSGHAAERVAHRRGTKRFDDLDSLSDRISARLAAEVPIVASLTSDQLDATHRTVRYTLATLLHPDFTSAGRPVIADRVRTVVTEWALAGLPLERTILAHELTVETVFDEASRAWDDHPDTAALARRLMKFLPIVTAVAASVYRDVTGRPGRAGKRAPERYLRKLSDGERDLSLERHVSAAGIDVGFRWAGATRRFSDDESLIEASNLLRAADRSALVGCIDDRAVMLAAAFPPSAASIPLGISEVPVDGDAPVVAEALRQAGRAADMGALLGVDRADYADLAPFRAAQDLPDHERERFVGERLGALLSHPRGDELLHTLATFYGNNMVRQATAAALYVHRHTLEYRLSRIAALTGTIIDAPAVRFQYEFALFLLGRFPR